MKFIPVTKGKKYEVLKPILLDEPKRNSYSISPSNHVVINENQKSLSIQEGEIIEFVDTGFYDPSRDSYETIFYFRYYDFTGYLLHCLDTELKELPD